MKVFGFEIGVVGGITETPRLESLVKEVDPSEDVSLVPHAGLLGIRNLLHLSLSKSGYPMATDTASISSGHFLMEVL